MTFRGITNFLRQSEGHHLRLVILLPDVVKILQKSFLFIFTLWQNPIMMIQQNKMVNMPPAWNFLLLLGSYN